MCQMHKTQEEVQNDRGRVQGKKEAKGASGVGGGVRDKVEVKECG